MLGPQSGLDLEWGDRVDKKDRDLYATLEAKNEILKFDTTGNSRVFASANEGLDHSVAITRRRH